MIDTTSTDVESAFTPPVVWSPRKIEGPWLRHCTLVIEEYQIPENKMIIIIIIMSMNFRISLTLYRRYQNSLIDNKAWY